MARTTRRVVSCLVFLAALAVVLAAFERSRGRRALQAYKASLLAKGERLTVEELTPGLSGEARTAAGDLIRASWQFRDGPILSKGVPSMKHLKPGTARVTWRESELRVDRSTNQWSELAAELEPNHQVLNEIRRILQAPGFDFGLNYKQGFNLLLPHLARIKGISLRLSAALLNDLHFGRLDEAEATLQALVRLPEVYRDEPLVISQLVRIAVAAIAVGPTWESLQAEEWSDAQLAGIQKQWESLEFTLPMERAIEMERAMGIEAFQRLRRSSAERKQLFSSLGGQQGLSAPGTASDTLEFALELGKKTLSSAGLFAREAVWAWLWSDYDEQRYLEIIQAMLEVPREARRDGSFRAAASQSTNRYARFFLGEAVGSPRYLLAYQLAPALEKASNKAARLEAQKRLVVTAIALKRHQLRYRRTPPSLAALVPEFLQAVPRDFMDGKELRYRPNPDGTYLLYSVNEDGRDDGGDPSPAKGVATPSFGNGHDMVWPMPATAAEIAESKAKEAIKTAAGAPRERYAVFPNNTAPKP